MWWEEGDVEVLKKSGCGGLLMRWGWVWVG